MSLTAYGRQSAPNIATMGHRESSQAQQRAFKLPIRHPVIARSPQASRNPTRTAITDSFLLFMVRSGLLQGKEARSCADGKSEGPSYTRGYA